MQLDLLQLFVGWLAANPVLGLPRAGRCKQFLDLCTYLRSLPTSEAFPILYIYKPLAGWLPTQWLVRWIAHSQELLTSGQFVHSRKLSFSQAEFTYLRRSCQILRYESSTPTSQELSISTFSKHIQAHTDAVPSRSITK